MALKTALVAALLIMALATAPPAASQLLLNLNVLVSGTVPCSSAAINITLTTPVFANATVVLLCGTVVVGTTVTNTNGAFVILLRGNLTIPALLGCRIIVPTPLSVCNSSLPTNGIQAPLQVLSAIPILGGILGTVTNLVPSIFQLVP